MALIYCIDSSSIIHLRHFPKAALGSLWDLLDTLTAQKRLVAPREVFREVAKQEDIGHAWAKAHKSVFLDPDADQGMLVQIYQDKYPALRAPDKPYHADPWCLALTALRNDGDDTCHLINEERDTDQASGKLPWLCKDLGFEWGRLLDIPRFEGLRFTLTK